MTDSATLGWNEYAIEQSYPDRILPISNHDYNSQFVIGNWPLGLSLIEGLDPGNFSSNLPITKKSKWINK